MMENLKVKVTTEQESKDVQELFFELGFTNGQFDYDVFPQFVANFNTDECGSFTIKTTNGLSQHKELTIQQLHDLVVLKRNDVNDATHTDQDGWKWYIGADSYVWQAGNSQQLKQWDQSSLTMVDLKIIEKEILETEYLMRGKNGERLMESVRQAINKSWGSVGSAGGKAAQTIGGVDGEEKHSHYRKNVKHLDFIDPYRIAQLYDLHPCADHIAKKALCTGKRGHKDLMRDIQDIIDTAERWKQMIQEDQNAI